VSGYFPRSSEALMSICVREAERSDAAGIVAMSAAVSATEGLEPPAMTAERLIEFCFEQRLVDAWVAEAQGALIGHVLATRSFDVQAGAPVRWICDLYVDPRFRRRGVGRRLLGAVSQCALKERVAYVQWLITPDNDLAVRFYNRIGARPDGGQAMFLAREEICALAAIAEGNRSQA
jgi:GNAT superfamily N-acetyltransferase